MEDQHRRAPSALWEVVATLARGVRMLMSEDDGSGRLRPSGSAVLLSSGPRRVVITAAHAVEGGRRTLLALAGDGTVRWPDEYWKLSPVEPHSPDADVAWASFAVADSADSLNVLGIPLDVARAAPALQPGDSLLAIGYPASRAKVMHADQVIISQLTSVIGEVARPEAYSDEAINPEVSIAMTFERGMLLNATGDRITGPHPRGMSGGALFLVLELLMPDGSPRLMPALVGVLTEYRERSQVMIATRIEHVLAGLYGEEGLYRRIAA